MTEAEYMKIRIAIVRLHNTGEISREAASQTIRVAEAFLKPVTEDKKP